MHEQPRQQRPLLGASEGQRAVSFDHLKRPKDSKLDHRMCPLSTLPPRSSPQSARLTGADAATAANGPSSTAVRPNPDGQTVTGATANRTSAAVYSRQDKSSVPVSSQSTTAKVSTPPPVVRLQAPASGFDWGDAGIGAAGGLALSMIGLGGALAVSQRQTRRARHPTA
jgi:hypothetical protein